MLLLSSGIASALLMDCIMRAVLIIIIVAGVWFELHNPGMGFPVLAAAVTSVLYFASLHSTVEGWDIILFVVGLVLLFVDVIVTPGFGVVGIIGIICAIAGLVVPMVGLESFGWAFFLQALLLTVVSVMVGCGLCLWLNAYIGKGKSSYSKNTSEQ